MLCFKESIKFFSIHKTKKYYLLKTKQLNNQASSTPLKITKKKKDKIFKLTKYFENLSHYFIYNI